MEHSHASFKLFFGGAAANDPKYMDTVLNYIDDYKTLHPNTVVNVEVEIGSRNCL